MENIMKWVVIKFIVLAVLIFMSNSAYCQKVKSDNTKKVTMRYIVKKGKSKKFKEVVKLHDSRNGNVYETGTVKIILKQGEQKQYNVNVSESEKGVTINFINKKQ